MVEPMPKSNNCRHENIFWEDLFKAEKQNNNNYRHKNAYCLDCNKDKGRIVAYVIQIWYCKKIKEWLIREGLAEKFTANGTDHYFIGDFNEFVKKNNFEEQWKKLQSGKIDDADNFESFIGQGAFFETAKSIEYLCQEFKKEKQNNPNQPINNNQTKAQLEQEINELENKSSLTSYQQKKLTKKRKKLAELNAVDNPSNNDDDNSKLNHRKKEQLQSEINSLESKPNKTDQEQTELDNKRKKLKELDDPKNKNASKEPTKPINYTPWLIGGGCLVVFVIILVLIISKKRK